MQKHLRNSKISTNTEMYFTYTFLIKKGKMTHGKHRECHQYRKSIKKTVKTSCNSTSHG